MTLSLTPAIEVALMKLLMKQKLFIYQIAKLEYKIYKATIKLQDVNDKILISESNITSANAAIKAAGKGELEWKLNAWKIKEEYKLFKLKLRKSKIDVIKLIVNQSKLEQTRLALISIEKSLLELEKMPMKEEIKRTNHNTQNLKPKISSIYKADFPNYHIDGLPERKDANITNVRFEPGVSKIAS